MLDVPDYSSGAGGGSLLAAICFVIAVFGGTALYFLRLSGRDENHGLKDRLHQFFTFKRVEPLLKVTYLILAVFVTIFPAARLIEGRTTIIRAALRMAFSNIAVRLVYELMLILVLVHKDTSKLPLKLNAPEADKADRPA